jgi:protease-4
MIRLRGLAGLRPWIWLLLGAVACEGRPRASSTGAHAGQDVRKGPFIALLDLSDGLPEQPSGGWLGFGPKGVAFDDLVRAIDRLGEESDVRGVLVRMGGARAGLARSTEVGAMLANLRGHLPIWCHADEYSNASLYLAARGCDRVWASPAGSVDAIGLAAQTIYFHKLLSEVVGLDVDFLQVGRFKGAEEPFTRDGPSPEARESLEATMTDLRSVWLEGLRAGRPRAEPSAAEDGPYAAAMAKEHNLVDEVGYFDAAREALEKATGAVRTRPLLGTPAQAAGSVHVGELLRDLAGESFGGAPIALVRATGAISMDGTGMLGDGGIVERRLIKTLTRLEKDDDVKAVVLRIDSPGGSALASDLLWHELMRIRDSKPLVVSIGDMAASGGYYLASAGSVVFADEASIVGSIGVVGGKIAANRALERIGVHAETFPAKVGDSQAAARAAYESLLVPWDDATRERVLETMTGVYDLFLQRVSDGRRIPIERVRASAEGRIFSGKDGKTRGLVDELGGLREAIGRARVLAHLAPDARLANYDEAPGFFQTLVDDEPEGHTHQHGAASALARGFTPDLVPLLDSLAPIAAGEQALCALPFALVVR